MGKHGVRRHRPSDEGVSLGSIAPDLPGPNTEFSIAVHRAPVTHRLKLRQVTRWAEGGGKSPRDVIERHRIRELLDMTTKT